ncbi:hypothetical protein [Arthrobacter sp. H35-D1]|uniref:hypothetical protein n=1 Tax=Arthrobacter sp. H35-D1 TaxID=3046202 RepID=UPI0024BABEC0|nr:hypothetical protein [Arthrobacter sp. H35-D1]MDJ0311859.1 hypothetical protein [Arthrobacter sp. H35-D1]
MNNKAVAALVLATTMTGAVGMSACAPQQDPSAPPSSVSSSTSSSTADANTLLQLNDSLRAKLGEAYSDSWIEDDKLHVAVTTEAAAAVVTDAGAIPKIVTIGAAALETALQAVSAWQASLPDAQGAAIHKIIPDGRTGTLTIFVAPEELDAVAKAAATDKPAGAVPLVIKASTGLATPL